MISLKWLFQDATGSTLSWPSDPPGCLIFPNVRKTEPLGVAPKGAPALKNRNPLVAAIQNPGSLIDAAKTTEAFRFLQFLKPGFFEGDEIGFRRSDFPTPFFLDVLDRIHHSAPSA
jgi:hypothetical protein